MIISKSLYLKCQKTQIQRDSFPRYGKDALNIEIRSIFGHHLLIGDAAIQNILQTKVHRKWQVCMIRLIVQS